MSELPSVAESSALEGLLSESCGKTAFLDGLALLSGLPSELLAAIGSRSTERHLAEDELLFRAGDAADALYFVCSGKVGLFVSEVGRATRFVAHVGPEEMFGEMGLLESAPRTTSARAAEPTTVLCLSAADFAELVAPEPRLMVRLSLVALRRSSANASRFLDPSLRDDPRVRVDRPVILSLEDGDERQVMLENLSAGGFCLRGLPAAELPEQVAGCLRLPDGRELLRFAGRIAWRRKRAAGVALTDSEAAQAEAVRGALAILFPGARPSQPRPAAVDQAAGGLECGGPAGRRV